MYFFVTIAFLAVGARYMLTHCDLPSFYFSFLTFLIIQWVTNNNISIFSYLESLVRRIPREKCYTHQCIQGFTDLRKMREIWGFYIIALLLVLYHYRKTAYALLFKIFR